MSSLHLRLRWVAVFGLLIAAQATAISTRAEQMVVAGYVENAWLENSSIVVRAKLDTGAKTSSINAPEYRTYKKGSETWIKFGLESDKGEMIDVDRRVIRVSKIRRSGVGVQSRPVIELDVCIAGKWGKVEFNLEDRSGMNYRILIGRSFLAGRILVDSGQSFLGSKLCK